MMRLVLSMPPHRRLNRLALTQACAGGFASYAAAFVVPPLIPTLTSEQGLGLSHAAGGALMSIFLLAYAGGSLFVAWLSRKWESRTLLSIGLILCAGASVAFPFTTNFEVLLTLRFLIGLGLALVYSPAIALILNNISAQRVNIGTGVFFGFLFGGSAVTYMAAPILVEHGAWDLMFYGAGVLCVLAALITQVKGPEMGRVERDVVGPKIHKISRISGRDKRLITISSGALFLAFFVLYGAFTWIPAYFGELVTLSSIEIGVASMLLPLVAIVSSPVSGWLADRLRQPMVVTGGCLLMASGVVFLPAVIRINYQAALVATGIIALGASGSLTPLFGLLSRAGSNRAVAIGVPIATAVSNVGGFVSTTLGGVLIGLGGYSMNFGVTSAVAVGSAVVVMVVLRPVLATLGEGSPRERVT